MKQSEYGIVFQDVTPGSEHDLTIKDTLALLNKVAELKVVALDARDLLKSLPCLADKANCLLTGCSALGVVGRINKLV